MALKVSSNRLKTALIGLQFGDEGKGKLTDFFSDTYDAVVRFQGGNNAGHTVVIGDKTFKHHYIPSGIHHKKLSLIADGVVIYPKELVSEIEEIGASPELLKISENCTLVMPYHIVIDSKTGKEIGTTKKGIGPCYSDLYARKDIRFIDILNRHGKIDKEAFRGRLEPVLEEKNRILESYGLEKLDLNKIMDDYIKEVDLLKPFITDTHKILRKLDEDMKDILFEGAQGSMLDILHGTHPFVTSSHTGASGTGIYTGIYQNLDNVIGVAKAYMTRVGNGPMVTEETGNVSRILQTRGKELGTTTNRLRRCGWFDAVLLKKAIEISGADSLALTKLDVLSELDEIKICTAYEIDGERIREFPSRTRDLEIAKPIYEIYPGWKKNISACRKITHLPKEARSYIDRIIELSGIYPMLISVGPERENNILFR